MRHEDPEFNIHDTSRTNPPQKPRDDCTHTVVEDHRAKKEIMERITDHISIYGKNEKIYKEQGNWKKIGAENFFTC